MGLFNNLKNILFDEEEDYTSQIKITPEMRNEEDSVKEEKKESPKAPEIKAKPVETPVSKAEVEPTEREIFSGKSDSFPFLDFDEEEFDSQQAVKKVEKPPVPEKRTPNVFEYERKKKIEKRTDYGRYEKTEITETIERKKFKPSPIISPVYGILNQDYNKNDIVQREDVDKMDIQSVRNKAFGEKKEPVKVPDAPNPRPTFYEETETVSITEPSEKEKKVKTIDELLENTSDIVVDIDRDMGIDDFEPEIELEQTQEVKPPKVDDTLENDLFDLIDSMYDDKEDGE